MQVGTAGRVVIAPDAKVFVVQDTTHDISKARQFGQFVHIIGRDIFPDDDTRRVRAMNNIIAAKMQTFRPDRDFILLIGDPVAILMVGQYLGSRHTHYNALKWDREAHAYYPISCVNPFYRLPTL